VNIASNPAMKAELARLEAIRTEPRPERARSHVALVREFLRRSALWATALDVGAEWPFFDIPSRLAPDADLSRDLMTAAEAISPTWYGKRIYAWHLHWVAAEPAFAASFRSLPAPYEPLIRLYERGGAVVTEGHMIDVPGAALPRGSFEKYAAAPAAVTALDDASLDAIDR
jgi:hypothetical protein